MNDEFWGYVHKEAVKFREKKRSLYIAGELDNFEMDLIESWYPVIYTEEPLAIDIELNKKRRLKQ